jgi:hypothetical protein
VESKRKSVPRKRKVKPRNIRAVPILVLSDTIFGVLVCFGVGVDGMGTGRDETRRGWRCMLCGRMWEGEDGRGRWKTTTLRIEG